MPLRKKLFISVVFAVLAFNGLTITAAVRGNEFDAVCNHLKSKYHAKKVKIPFIWLARAVVGIVRPAGVKSFKVTIFKNLHFSKDSLHSEMQAVMSDAFSEDWSPILRIRSRDGDQVYMNMREAGNNIKILVVTINRDEAVVVRAKFGPERLANFIENPKIFGISLDEDKQNTDDPDDQKEKHDKVVYEDNNDTE